MKKTLPVFLRLFLGIWGLGLGAWSFAQTGPNNPGTAVNDGSYGSLAWTAPANVIASDNVYASASMGTNGQSTNYVNATNFGFSINSCDNITGIEVRVEWVRTGSPIIQDDQIVLVIGGVVMSASNKGTGTALPTVESVTTYGSPSDTWGQTLTGADVNKSNFGVAIAVKRNGTGSAPTVQIDNITIKLYHSTPGVMTYSSSAVTQVTNFVSPNSTTNPVIRIDVATNTGCPSIAATSFTFNANGTTSLSDIQNAKLFYTGTSSTFSSAAQLGSTVASPTYSNFTISGFSQALSSGTNYFWLSYDVTSGATIGNVIDGECTSLIVDAISRTPSPTAPAGNRVITGPNVYTVGASHTYQTIQAAYNAIPVSPSNNSLIEIYSDYNSGMEPFPITFGNKSNAYNIVVRPAAGNSNIICQGSIGSQGLWNLNGAVNIIIDGRAGGVGTTKDFLVRNNQGSSPWGTAFLISNDAQNIFFNYLTIESETVSGLSLDGIVTIGGSTGTTGNDNISISNCLFRDVTGGGGFAGGVPWSGVYSTGTSGKTNDNITVSSCEFAGGGINAINIFSNSGSSTVINNQIYSPTGLNPGTNDTKFINISSGSGHIVSGNYIGGSTTNCGNPQLSLSGTTAIITGISVSASGNNVISGNTIANIKYTPTTGSGYPLIGISVSGSGNFTIGSSGNGNTIGNMSGTGSFMLTHNGSSGNGIAGINCASTGTVSIAYNNFGSMTLNGARIGAETNFVLVGSGSGMVTIDNNTFGSTVANNISILSNSALFGIKNSSTNGIAVTNNTFQNIAHGATSHSLGIIFNTAGALTCTGNLFQNIASTSDCSVNQAMFMIDHQPGASAAGTVSNNTIQNITMGFSGTTSAKLYCISMNSPGGASVCSNNTVGSATSNNITVSANTAGFGIYHSGAGTLTCNNNTIQQFNLTNTGSGGYVYGIMNSSGAGAISASGNTVKDITAAFSTAGAVNFGIAVFSGAGNLLTKNTIQNLHASNTTGAATVVDGIYVDGSGGSVTKNFISGLTNQSASTAAVIAGVETNNASSWGVHNNVILLDNSPYANTFIIYGINERSTGVMTYYHNTVKLSGTSSAGGANTMAFYRNSSGTHTVENNIFQNLRTGGGNTHYAEFNNVLGGTYTTDYNYLEASQTTVGKSNGVDCNFAVWKTTVGANNDLNGTTTLDAQGVPPVSFIGANGGTNLSATVPDDYLNNARDATPSMGGYEVLSNTITTTPFGPQTLLRCTPFTVTFTTTGTFNAGNIFTAQLSDASGSFAAPLAIGSASNTSATPITCIIPGTTAAGTKYRIRVTASNPSTIGTDNGSDLTLAGDGGTGTWTWQGGSGTDWFDRCNWDKKTLPDASSDVSIPNTANKPTITGANANCNTISIDSGSGAVLTIDATGGWKLNITQ